MRSGTCPLNRTEATKKFTRTAPEPEPARCSAPEQLLDEVLRFWHFGPHHNPPLKWKEKKFLLIKTFIYRILGFVIIIFDKHINIREGARIDP
jgi:hypothetical protein